MIAGKIKFLPENPPTPPPSYTPARSLAQLEKPASSKSGLPQRRLAGGSTQGFTEGTGAALQPFKTLLPQPAADQRNNTRKTVIRWRAAKDEIDVEEIVHRIIDRLHREA